MGDPHNPRRAGELWDPARIDGQMRELEAVRELVVVSGGWAWHFMSPPGHREVKTHHDHKDVDLFVKPRAFEKLRTLLDSRGFRRARTKYDDPSGRFYRFAKPLEEGKVVLDVFLEEVPSIRVRGFRVVEPARLLTFYGVKHSSDQCTAVRAARRLLEKGISPVDRPELVGSARSGGV